LKLYLECGMGAAGDMLMAALLELLPDKALFLHRMRNLGLSGVEIDYGTATKCGITGTKMHIRINGIEEGCLEAGMAGGRLHKHERVHIHDPANDTHHDREHTHPHYKYQDICGIIENLDLAENVKKEALGVYRLLVDAESAVHGVPAEQIHFHEVGSLDAVVDIVGCSLLFHMLGVTQIEASPVHVGSGFVRCAHGVLPVPAPATAHILRGVPIYGGKIKGELCTPTGAALLRHFVERFGDMEPITVTKIGYGMGTKDYEAANCVRAYLCENAEAADMIAEITCNLDDMTPEAVGYAIELLLESGALDVFTTPIFMKKNRPATMLTCLCKPDDRHHMTQLIMTHTTTLGVRYQTLKRDIMEYARYAVQTPYGEIRIKSAKGHGLTKEKPEYEDVRSAAIKNGVPFSQVYTAAVAMMESNKS
jgi:uncharacterized protein (TIGR00299 family) protein